MSSSAGTSSRKSGFSLITKFFIGLLVAFLGFFGILSIVNPPEPETAASSQTTRSRRPAAQTPPATTEPTLRLEGWSWSDEAGWVTAEGQVTNTGTATVEHVEVVISWFTSDGSFITSESALIEYDPLLSGQTSPWKVMARHNPAMSKARVEFKRMFGGKLPHTKS